MRPTMHLNRYRAVGHPYVEHIFVFVCLVITTLFGFSGIVYGLSKPVNEYLGLGNISGCVDPTIAHCYYSVYDQKCYGYYGCFFVSLYFNLAFYLIFVIGLIIYFRYNYSEEKPVHNNYNSSGEIII